MQHDDRAPETSNRYRTVSRYVFFGFVGVAAYFLFAEHRAHIVPFLPFVLLAACLLMHLFHHGGHKHSGGDDESRSDAGPTPPSGGGAHQH